MTGSQVEAGKLAEVAKLATAIADRILEQNAAGTTIPPEQFTMLVKAAQMLQDNDAPWPPSVEEVVMEVAKRVALAEAASEASPPLSEGDDVVVHLTQFLGAVHQQDDGGIAAGPPSRSEAIRRLVAEALETKRP